MPIMQSVRLLIVDDDEDDFLLAKDLLDEIVDGDYCLDWASTFEEGQALLRENNHDLCLLDYKLGARDGLELLRLAEEAGFSGPIILLTGIHQAEIDIKALRAGAVDYLVKAELSAQQLARSIRYALARREVERERVERLKAEAKNRLKSEFLAHLSHELRTPLSAILGFTELLMNKNCDTEDLAHLQAVHRNGKHLLGLLNDILDLSKIEAGKLELEYQTLHLPSFLTDIYFLMQGAALDKNLQLRLDVSSPLPVSIITDPTRLRQILLNLVGNAIKFTHEGEVLLKIRLIQQDDRAKLHFVVRDTGIGIQSDTLEHIFEPFVQSKTSQRHPGVGTGLGLTISKQLVARLGGEIHVNSEVGQGSEFSFTLDPGDLANVELAVLNLDFDMEHNVEAVIPKFTGRVLVVDDLRDIRTLIGHFVEMTGLDVSYAANGLEAINLINAAEAGGTSFDIVFMDIHMPVMDGHEAAQKLRAGGFTKPLIALTAAHMKGDMSKCLESGFTAYLGKPIDRVRLHSCIAQFVLEDSAAPVPVSVHSVKQPTILVIEDNPDALQATASLLALLGWRVITAASAEEAFAKATTETPRVILIDLNLPFMSGYEVATQLRRILPGARLIIASGQEIDPQRAQAAGVDGSLLKPVSLAQLETLLA